MGSGLLNFLQSSPLPLFKWTCSTQFLEIYRLIDVVVCSSPALGYGEATPAFIRFEPRPVWQRACYSTLGSLSSSSVNEEGNDYFLSSDGDEIR